MLFVHEVHSVVGTDADRFEDAYRDGWMPLLAKGSDARLLWYFDHAHGSGPAYRVVTVTAVEDGAAWLHLADRMARGDLQSWARHRDGLQHESRGRILTPLLWSPGIGRLADVPTEPAVHEPTMYMEDTMWPFPGKVREYIEAAGTVYRQALGAEGSQVHMSIELALQSMPGAGRYPEVTLLQKLSSLPLLIRLLTNDIPTEVTRPGSWMHEALDLRDQWQSKLLRTTAWSPLQ
ncbi:MAG: hypothetical protein ABSF33_02945 [Acidimicrobiales bacterium]